MMKRLITSLVLAGSAASVSAHTLPGDEGTVAQLGHQLSGAHHLPVLLALVALVLAGMHYLKRGRSR
jgi:hypothetical protein